MTQQTKRILSSAFFSVVVVSVVAFAANVTIPNTFTAGTPAKASEVNANFQAVKTAVDDNQSQITALKARACGTGTTKVGDKCMDSTVRVGLVKFQEGATACATAGGELCSAELIMAAVEQSKITVGMTSTTTSDGEWSGSHRTYCFFNATAVNSVCYTWGAVMTSAWNAGAPYKAWIEDSTPASTANMYAQTAHYRCCFTP